MAIQEDRNYYEWLISFIRSDIYLPEDYKKLLTQLLNIDFVYYYPMDENRAFDGLELRDRYVAETNKTLYFAGNPCSVLEMMISLALRMDIEIMFDEDIGDRTPDWFWGMIESLGLIGCTDDDYDLNYILDVIGSFLRRDYSPNGNGGLFSIDEHVDIRDREIWYQMQMYLNYIIERRLI